MRGMRRKSDAAAHHQSVHDRDHRLRIARDQHIELVFGGPELCGQRAAGLRRIVQRADVAAGAKRTLAGAVDEHRTNRGIVRPFTHEGGHGHGHVERDRVQRLRPIERDPPQRTQLTDNNVAVLQN